MTQTKTPRQPRAGLTRPNANIPINGILSVGVNLGFQAALRGFLEAQRQFTATRPTDASYPQQERIADGATADLIRTIDELIQRRQKGRDSTDRRKGRNTMTQATQPTYADISGRLQALMTKHELMGTISQKRMKGRTAKENAKFLLTALAVAIVSTERPSLGLTEMNVLSPSQPQRNTVERARRLLLRLVYKQCEARIEPGR